MKNKTIADYYNKIDPKKAYDDAIAKLKVANQENPISLSTMEYQHIENKDSNLNGVIYSIKDIFCTKGHVTTGASKALANYVPEINATVKDILDAAGAICISKDNCDEFALGGTGQFSGFAPVHNPHDKTRIAGGSSSGSSCMVDIGIVPFAIGSDTGDSTRKPASQHGIVGFKPTYGAISRYGVLPYSATLDHVGILANNVDDVARVFTHLAKHDDKDLTSLHYNEDFFSNLKADKKQKIVVLTDALENMLDGEKAVFKQYLNNLSKQGFNISYEEFSVELLSLISPIYMAISYGEATTAWAKLNGILFGMNDQIGNNYDEIAMHNRSQYFGHELKRRFTIGAYVTSSANYWQMFNQAKYVRTAIINRANQLLAKYDALVIPGASRIAPLIEEITNDLSTCNICDDALEIANFGGYPSITVPAITYNNMFVGINIMADRMKEQKLFNLAKAIMEANNVQ